MHARSVVLVSLVALVAPLHAQLEAALKEYFEGRSGRVTAEFAEGVLFRFTVTSQ